MVLAVLCYRHGFSAAKWRRRFQPGRVHYRPLPASRKYTVAEANALVPWLEKTFAAIDAERSMHETAAEALEQLVRRATSNGHGDTDHGLRDARKLADGTADAVRNLLAAVVEKDIEVRDVATGLVDFLGDREGREVWLCWRRGEASVAHWHELDRGFADRKPL